VKVPSAEHRIAGATSRDHFERTRLDEYSAALQKSAKQKNKAGVQSFWEMLSEDPGSERQHDSMKFTAADLQK
jgi:hypothetical protein